ncbi:MAG: TerB N-terminal domain-containing protein [Gammaproteobacteria bacterium]|nr:TerB N-terminal domain-containing protein [Gammaproteobacteria bacterium]MDE0272283.1 TerB N-terminal domain-containing protein [Gammaproteobacteria bacterium]
MEIVLGLLAVFLIVIGLSRLGRPESIERPTRPKSQFSVPQRRSRGEPVRWIPPEGDTTVAGRSIGGFVYVGSEETQDGWHGTGGMAIDPRLPVAKAGTDFVGESMPYWPCYSDIDRGARATYLDWLVGDRSDKRVGPGYVFLYFYGLERRFFVDNPTRKENELILAEVERLQSLYGENGSVRRYLGTFIDTARLVLNPEGDAEATFQHSGYELPLGLRVAIGRKLRDGRPLDSDWLLAWYVADPNKWLRTPARRAFAEFRALFGLMFEDKYPEGLRQRSPKRLIRANYYSASSEFDVDITSFLGDIPDIAGLSRPLNIADAIVEQATAALDKYSRFLGRNPDGRDTIEAHALLPERLWQLFPSAEMENLREWADEVVERGGLLPVEEVVAQLEGVTPTKVGKRQLTGAADALARLSIGMAPDPRFALRGPKVGEPVVLFRLPEGITALEEVSDDYRHVLVAIAVGSFVAHADGTIAEREHAALRRRIEETALSAQERARLVANLRWMVAVPPDLALFRRRLADISEDVRHQFGQVALAMAAADGVIDPGEIKAVERLYKSIGLATDGIYSALHALTAASEPVTVRPAQGEPKDFTIPAPKHDRKVSLDAGRVAALLADTARASAVLGDIFSDDDAEDMSEQQPEEETETFAGLEPKHAAFLSELLTRPRWEESDVTTLARQFELMQAGAIETLNEWSFECFGDTLIEEYDGYEINTELSAEIANQHN